MQEQDKEKLIVFDTTLRDGEQSAGGAMRVEDKVTVAKQLERLGVDVIEAGFPISSPGDMQAVKQIAAAVKHSCVCALARANDDDVDAGLEAIADARYPRLHTFIATSKLHMAKKLGLEPDEVLERAVRAVARARNATADVEFSAEDAGRSEIDFLCRIIEAAIKAGASTINIPDTVGYTMPDEFAQRVRELIERVPNSDKAVFSVHCHNDLGVGVANSLAAIQVGARQVECTINGIGERAGNAALEEIVMAIRTRNALFPCEVGINAAELVPTSQLVEKVTGIQVQPNKAIVGINAFAHESGIHQDGVLKSRETYEIMRAEDVGWDSNRIQLGKLSGRRAFKQRLAELGFQLEGSSFDQAFGDFKNLADSQRLVSDDDLIKIASRHAVSAEKVAR